MTDKLANGRPAPRSCSTCGHLLTADDAIDSELFDVHDCRFCRYARDFSRFLAVRSHRGAPRMETWQLILLSQWMRVRADIEMTAQ